MADLDGSGVPRTHRHVTPSSGVPLVLRPAPNRHFPLPGLNRANAVAAAAAAVASADKKHKPLMPINKIKDDVDQNIQGETEQEHREEIRVHMLTDISSPDVKQQKTRKASKSKRSLQEVGSVDGRSSDPLASNICRYDSSLSLLTKKFVNLLQKTEDGTLDLTQAAVILEVQKRRIYDITNVLEGVGVLEKCLKNRMRWKRNDAVGDHENQFAQLKVANGTLFREERRLDQRIREMQKNLTIMTEGCSRKLLYLAKEDINSLRCLQNSTLFAIKAPHGTSLEVPNPDEGLDFPQRRYEMYLRSSIGPIDCFLISNRDDRVEIPNQDYQHIPMGLSAEYSCNNKDGASCSHPGGLDNAIYGQLQAQETPKILSDPVISQEGIVRMLPPECDVNDDYWFQTDRRESLTDIWSN